MFGGSFRTFEEDPFFRDFHETQQQMMGGLFGNMFGASPFMLTDGSVPQHTIPGAVRHPSPHPSPQGIDPRALQRRMEDPWSQAMSPFGGFNMMGNIFRNMNDNFGRMANDPNNHSYSQSSSVSYYSNTGQGAPQFYQATESTKSAPGGVKEVTKSVRDSNSGTQKMSVQRQIGERSHRIEKSKDVRSGDMEENQDFVNLDETDAATFDQEFRDRTSHRSSHHSRGYVPISRKQNLAVTDGRSQSYRDQNRRYPTPVARPQAPSQGKRPKKSDLHEI